MNPTPPSANKSEVIVLVNPPNPKIVLRDLLCSTISKGTYNWPNIDLLTISGTLKEHFIVRLVDANTLGFSENETIEMIVSLDPAGVVFSFGVSVKEEDYRFVRRLREKLPDIKFCGTGGLLYYNSEEELHQHPEFDACLKNFTTNDILQYFQGRYDDMNNITYRDNGRIFSKPLVYPDNNYAHPIPCHEQLPLKSYRLSHGKALPMTTMLTSWGCPSHCTFCYMENIEYRYRSVDNIIEEMAYLRKLGIKEIFFRDGSFCTHRKQGQELLHKMIENNFGFSWVANVRANVITRETAQLMKRSGCHALHIGVETSNDTILQETVKKNITLAKIREAFSLCRESNILTLGYFILGLPGETAADLRRTIDLAIELDCDYASFNMFWLQDGTSLRGKAIAMGLLNNTDKQGYDGSLKPVAGTGGLPPEEIVEFQKLAFRKFYIRPRFIYKSIARLRNLHQFKMLLVEFIYFFRNRFLS